MTHQSVPRPSAIALNAPVIQVQGLCKRYGSLEAVSGLTFTVHPGEIFGLIGPDGAGKTSTFNILAGVMEATSGKVSILGQIPRAARLHLGYLTQTFSLYPDLTLLENLRYTASLRHVPDADFRDRTADLLQRMGLAQYPNRLAKQLSGGMKQKLALCCALVSRPQVLLLDEPTTGVDPVSRREFWDLLAAVAAEGVTVVAATPYLDEAERCHRIALIHAGQIQQIGTLRELQVNLGLHRIEVRSPQLIATATALQAVVDRQGTALVDLQSFGDRLDVLTSDLTAGQAAIRATLPPQLQAEVVLETSAPTLENVFVNLLRQQGSEPPDRPFPYYRKRVGVVQGGIAIAAQKLQKRFGSFWAVQDVSLTVHYGEIYGLLGANGAGKTTTIKMLCGLLPLTQGRMSLAGETEHLHRAAVRSRIGYLSQKFTLYDDLTIRQNLEFYCGVYGVPRPLHREKIGWVLEICGLVDRADVLTSSLPEGWKQRVAFGASVLHEPDLLFLDEPTSGVDPLARRQFWRLIRDFARQGTAILVTTHYLEEAENCNRMAFMVAGKIVAQGSPTQIKASQPGQLLELVTSHTQAASNLLKQKLAPWRVSIFGDRLHLVLEHPNTDLGAVQNWLQAAHIQVKAQRTLPFSLEDAFIGTVQRATSKAASEAASEAAPSGQPNSGQPD